MNGVHLVTQEKKRVKTDRKWAECTECTAQGQPKRPGSARRARPALACHAPSALPLELANRAGGSGWAEPTPGQENNRADRAGPDLNRAAISLTQPGPISG